MRAGIKWPQALAGAPSLPEQGRTQIGDTSGKAAREFLLRVLGGQFRSNEIVHGQKGTFETDSRRHLSQCCSNLPPMEDDL